MKRLTITLDEQTAAWVTMRASELNVSVSRVVGEMLRARMHDEREYEHAMRRFLARKPIALSKKGQPYSGREALHDRVGLRETLQPR